LPHQVLSFEFIFMVNAVPTQCIF